MKALQQYLREIFGVQNQPHFDKELIRKLPLYLRGNYDLYIGSLSGRKIIWAAVKSEEHPTPDQLKKQSLVLQELLGHFPVVFVFESLEAWQRKRLIEKRIGFAEPFRQLYIPQLFTQIRDGHGKETMRGSPAQILKPPAQFLLLYHLQVSGLEELPFLQIARQLHYSPMTVTRAVQELIGLGIVQVEGTKEKSILFTGQGRRLWDKALPYLASPIRETWYNDKPVENEYTRSGGEMALARYSMLSTPDRQTYVIGKDAFRRTKSSLVGLHQKYGDHTLEVWHYDPTILSPTNEVDKLSLYLTLQDHEDERIQGALRNMINEMIWL